jgi:uncharacterized protein
MLKQLVEYVVKSLVDQPEAVVVTEVAHEAKITLEVRVAPQDLKRVIGKDGRVIRAIRTMVNCVGPSSPKEVILDILE